ncbi:MAG: cytochrome C oxidase subunit IV family protein [Pseudodesulfovibrio sp.]|uniref:Cytochrome c oxidase subunit 4 n=1 Tax=Pseudodesulfovibrio indicus TaxID=1716143 RepID=A0A126QS91_9BACT|nr:cytochrome C oxidase subunit IV family protein [Pseudodesulfovibrio indicus]AMK12619.1 cytochrome-c oxidase [Pseudodesulfovibrio indicus]TDT90931.1 cytochrome c oxidase subunit 4 [Pseudodesulfovibrio indicus]
MSENTNHHAPGYGLFIGIWGALMVLTAVTVGVAQVHLGFLNVVVAMAIASLKASLVVFFFMHLKYENRTLKTMVLVAFVILAIFIGFTFFDTANR